MSEARDTHAIEFLRPRDVRNIPNAMETAKAELAIELIRSSAALRLRQWTSAFDAFVAVQTPAVLGDPSMHETILICRVHRLLMDLSYKVDYRRAVHDEMLWDELLLEYAEIIRLAEEFTACSTPSALSSSKKGTEGKLVFTLDPGLNVPLYFVAGKCRDHTIRRKAIALLRAIERQEGVSNSVMTAKVAERLVEIEEEGLLDREGERGGPEWVERRMRVSGVDIRFEGEEQRALVRFFRGEEEGGVVEEWVEW